jgi:hypothetical protein
MFIFQLVEACHQYNKHKTDIIKICDVRHNFIDNIQRNCDNFHHLSEKKICLWILTKEDNNILLKLYDFLLKGFNLRTVTSI